MLPLYFRNARNRFRRPQMPAWFYTTVLIGLVFLLPPAAGGGGPGEQPASGILTLAPGSDIYELRAGGRTTFQLHVRLLDNWHINSHRPDADYLIPSRLRLAAGSPFVLEEVQYPRPVEARFAFSETPVRVFEGEFVISGRLRAPAGIQPGMHRILLEFTFQGCRDKTCTAPETVRTELPIRVRGQTSDKHGAAAGGPPSFSGRLESAGRLLSLVLVFFGGLTLNLTPCVYPIIPVTVGYFGAQSEGRTRRLFILGLLYVAGMAVSYSVIGVVTALTGAVFGGLLQHTAVTVSIVAVFVVLALGMFGVYEFRMPDQWVSRVGAPRRGLFGALFMGLTMGVVAVPCIGPFVLGLLTYVAARAEPVYGFLLFFFLALGLGVPYLFLALFAGKIKALPRSGQWMVSVRRIFGLVLLGMAIYFAAPLLPDSFRWAALPVFGILAAIYLLFFDRSANNVPRFRIFKYVLSVLLVSVSVLVLFSARPEAGAEWPAFTPATYQEALEKNQKMVIVFHADWCLPCRELKAQTLSHPRVQRALQSFRVFQVDLSRAADPRARAAVRRFDIQGVPTVIMIDSSGTAVERITGLIGAGAFVDALEKIE